MFEMLSNVFENLFNKPATRLFPFVARKDYKNARGKIGAMRIDDCIYCGICERKCPSLALKVDKAAKSWTIDRYKCIICQVCVDVCPKKCIDMDESFMLSTYSKTKDVYAQGSLEDKQQVEVVAKVNEKSEHKSHGKHDGGSKSDKKPK